MSTDVYKEARFAKAKAKKMIKRGTKEKTLSAKAKPLRNIVHKEKKIGKGVLRNKSGKSAAQGSIHR